jgi:hypothetical protein
MKIDETGHWKKWLLLEKNDLGPLLYLPWFKHELLQMLSSTSAKS